MAAACAGSDPPTQVADAAAVTVDAGGGETAAPCNDLASNAAVTHPSCAVSCTVCPDASAAAPREGTYVMTSFLMYTTDCSRLTATNVRGRLRVAGNVMDLAIEQPGAAIGDIEITRMRYTFALSNRVLNLQWVCPPTEGGSPSQVIDYSSDGRALRFSILPGTHGDTIFVPE